MPNAGSTFPRTEHPVRIIAKQFSDSTLSTLSLPPFATLSGSSKQLSSQFPAYNPRTLHLVHNTNYNLSLQLNLFCQLASLHKYPRSSYKASYRLNMKPQTITFSYFGMVQIVAGLDTLQSPGILFCLSLVAHSGRGLYSCKTACPSVGTTPNMSAPASQSMRLNVCARTPIFRVFETNFPPKMPC